MDQEKKNIPESSKEVKESTFFPSWHLINPQRGNGGVEYESPYFYENLFKVDQYSDDEDEKEKNQDISIYCDKNAHWMGHHTTSENLEAFSLPDEEEIKYKNLTNSKHDSSKEWSSQSDSERTGSEMRNFTIFSGSSIGDAKEYNNIPDGLINFDIDTENTYLKGLDRILLNIIDEASFNSLLKQGISLTQSIRLFLECILELLTKKPFSCSEFENDECWVERANCHMMIPMKKRVDQKIRMIFNRILRRLFKNSYPEKSKPSKISKESKLLHFLEKYGNKDSQKFESHLNSCKFPSKKKLKSLFTNFITFRSDFAKEMEKGSISREILDSRLMKATTIVGYFHEANRRFPNDKHSIVSWLTTYMKLMPWSEVEVLSSCDTLWKILVRSGHSVGIKNLGGQII